MTQAFDDAEISAEDPLYRRINKESPSCLVENEGRFELGIDAFVYDHGSGCSVSLERVWKRHGGSLGSYVDWDEFGVARFPVDFARSADSGVLQDPTEEDPAHALIRVRDDDTRALRRRHWFPIRSRLRESSEYIHTCPEGT